jgi:hypothetical protein
VGQLCLMDDDDVVHVYGVELAEYNVYEEDGHHWLTLYARTDSKIAPDDEDPSPFVELNLPFPQDPGPLLRAGEILKVTSYDEELFNLASMYYWTHRAFDGTAVIEAAEEVGSRRLKLLVKGEADDDPVAFRAEFEWNPDRRRSFD